MAEQEPLPYAELAQLLGELELAIMQTVWAQGETTVRAVWEALRPTRPLAYTTVMTVMNRLVQKGVLRVHKRGRAYTYQAVVTAGEFVTQHAQRAVEDVIANFGDAALTHFLRNLHDLPLERRAALQQLIAQEHDDAS